MMTKQRSFSGRNTDAQRAAYSARPFQFAKFLSWSSLGLIFVTGLILSIIIANSARKTLLTKQREFALLLAENLNHQIYRRFTLPTIIGFGRIALKQPAQYERLEQVIQSTIHGLHVNEVLIYDNDLIISYATNDNRLGEEHKNNLALIQALNRSKNTFEIDSRLNPFLTIFSWETKRNSVTMRTVYPLRAEHDLSGENRDLQPIMGVLEFTQDITEDYRTVIRFQRLIIVASFVWSLILFLVLLMIIRRADRINAERLREKENYERELHQSERMASMGRMVAGVAHEIRNPLGIIRSSAELLLRKAQNDNDLNARILRAIYDESKRLSRTVSDFLDYARPKQPKQESVDLAAVLDQVTMFLEHEFTKHDIELVKNYWSDLRVMGDKDLLYRAFYNVLGNAIQATEGPGRITIRSSTSKRLVILEVEDTGPGFDEKTREKILDPFYTTKEDGTGLGLPIVNTIVANHGGELELADGDAGALVRMRFPAAEAVKKSRT